MFGDEMFHRNKTDKSNKMVDEFDELIDEDEEKCRWEEEGEEEGNRNLLLIIHRNISIDDKQSNHFD